MGAVPEEQPVWITLNGVRRIVLSCSPGDVSALALGHLLGEGWIRDAGDVHTLAAEEGNGTSGAVVEIDADQLEVIETVRRHQTLHGCGLRHVLDCDPGGIAAVQPPPGAIDPAVLLRALFAAADDVAPEGGVHAAALSDGDRLYAVAIDVARHCAADRAIGIGLRERGDTTGLGLVCTARISGAIALKAVRARLGWIASRSVATTLAHEIAAAYGLLLLERGGRPR